MRGAQLRRYGVPRQPAHAGRAEAGGEASESGDPGERERAIESTPRRLRSGAASQLDPSHRSSVLLPQVTLLAAIAMAIAYVGAEPGSILRHLYLIPTLWAALAGGRTGGAAIGLLAGLLQAPVVLPAVERLGLTSQTLDGLVSLAAPVAIGWAVGRLVDQARERAHRLRAVLEVQRALSHEAPLEARLNLAAERIRASLGAERVGVVLGSETGDRLVAGGPGPMAVSYTHLT